MEIEKAQVVHFLHEAGLEERAQAAQAALPDPVDTDENAGLLHELGVDLKDLTQTGLG